MVKFLREGTAEVFKYCNFAVPPPPYPLRLNIDTCINKQPNKSNNKLAPYQPVYRRPPAQKKSIEEKSIINRVPVYIQLTEKNKNKKKITIQILHNFFVCVFSLTVEKVLTDQHDSGLLYSTDAVIRRSQPL